MLRDAGFEQVVVAMKPESAEFIQNWLPGSDAEKYVVSANVTAVKPAGAASVASAAVTASTTAPPAKKG